MTTPLWSGLVKRLSLPEGWAAPTELTYDDIRARALTRDHLRDDVRGINASIDLIRRTRGGRWPAEPLTEELLGYDVDVSWWVTPDAYEHGYYAKLYGALRHWIATAFPFAKAYHSNKEIPASSDDGSG
jgi:hypothetical protein